MKKIQQIFSIWHKTVSVYTKTRREDLYIFVQVVRDEHETILH